MSNNATVTCQKIKRNFFYCQKNFLYNLKTRLPFRVKLWLFLPSLPIEIVIIVFTKFPTLSCELFSLLLRVRVTCGKRFIFIVCSVTKCDMIMRQIWCVGLSAFRNNSPHEGDFELNSLNIFWSKIDWGVGNVLWFETCESFLFY